MVWSVDARSGCESLWIFIDQIVLIGSITSLRVLFLPIFSNNIHVDVWQKRTQYCNYPPIKNKIKFKEKSYKKFSREFIDKGCLKLGEIDNMTAYWILKSKSYSGWNKSRKNLFWRMANVFIFVGNVFILLFPSILSILIMGL